MLLSSMMLSFSSDARLQPLKALSHFAFTTTLQTLLDELLIEELITDIYY